MPKIVSVNGVELEALNIRVPTDVRAGIKELKHRRRMETDSDVVRMILRERLVSEGVLPPDPEGQPAA